jgi:hypothetical protein
MIPAVSLPLDGPLVTCRVGGYPLCRLPRLEGLWCELNQRCDPLPVFFVQISEREPLRVFPAEDRDVGLRLLADQAENLVQNRLGFFHGAPFTQRDQRLVKRESLHRRLPCLAGPPSGVPATDPFSQVTPSASSPSTHRTARAATARLRSLSWTQPSSASRPS